MESSSWPESLPSNRVKAIQELTRGQILTNKLYEMLGQSKEMELDLKSADGVVEQILGMFDNTLSILSLSSFNGIIHPHLVSDVRSPSSSEDQKSEVTTESIKTVIPIKTKRGCYKRRRNTSTVIKFVSALLDDGYAWRKYGQKSILNSKHQRNYYRCGHKFEQGCQATKQVQKTNDEKYKITYYGSHTCNGLQRAPQIIVEAPNPRDNSILINFETNAFTENNKVGTRFQLTKHTTKEDFPSLGHLEHEEVSSSNDHTPFDPIVGLSQVPSESMSMISELDHEDMFSSRMISSTCSTHGGEISDIIESYEVNDIIGSYDFGEFLFE